MDAALHEQMVDLASHDDWESASAIADRLIPRLERQAAAPDRDGMLADALHIRSHIKAMTYDLSGAIADGGRALDVLAQSARRDEVAMATILQSHIVRLAEAGDTEAIRRLDHTPMATYRRLHREASLDGSLRRFMSGQIAKYAVVLHSIGEHEVACACDREVLDRIREEPEYLDFGPDRTAEAYITCVVLLIEQTPDVHEAKDNAAEAVLVLTKLMDLGRYQALPGLLRVLVLLGLTQANLGDGEAGQSFADARYLLTAFPLDAPGTPDLAEIIKARLDADPSLRGWYFSDDVVAKSAEWRRGMADRSV